ncbi:MAG TPA: adenylate/guanylate cyclase domain-containing protein, partial [Spirochaetia bacterium]
ECLHADMFDARASVALSALAAVGALGDARSYPYVARLATNAQEEVQCAAVKALGSIPHTGVVKLLIEMLKTTRTEKLRREILSSLCTAAPRDKNIVGIVRSAARTPMGSAAARAYAAGLFLRVGGELALEELLVDARDEILDQVLTSASRDPGLVSRAVAHCAPLYARLPARNRATLVTLAASQQLTESPRILHDALGDPHAEVRRAAYAALGTGAHQVPWLSNVVSQMSQLVETNPALEDEAQQAITRMGGLKGAGESVSMNVRVALMSRVSELHKALAAEGRKVASESHELGWLIMRSKEYVEYYCDDEFKAGLLRWLKGASSDTEEGLLKMLKATAVRVEVRHFDGYSAVADLIKNPKRNGITLVTRELAVAKTGKSHQLWQLVRILRLAALFLSPASGATDAATLRSLYAWAKQEKMYRLAEAALGALARVDVPGTIAACRECVAVPLASKILAISALHLLRELNLDLLEPAATRLLASQDDPYVTLNALEAISQGPSTSSGELAKALISRLSLTASGEVRDALVAYLGEKVTLDITESIKPSVLSGDAEQRAAFLAVLDRRISAGLVANRDGTIEFLYRILRGDDEPSRRAAAVILWKMGDDYALEVLRDFLSAGSDEDAAAMLRHLSGYVRESLFPSLAVLLVREAASVQSALRDLLLPLEEPSLRAKTLEMALGIRGGAGEEEPEEEIPLVADNAPAVEVRSERSEFQFERENMQELVMLFSDIQGYSKKAQVLPPMQLSALIQDYEKILLTHIEAHGGELVKRMGDGHMVIFHEPLPAVLAAIRIQKSLRRFNRYRDETTRVVIRIGIHSGKVVRKSGGDVLGNAVNIASRLESSSQPGSILISDRVHEKVRDAVHAREIGQITVKNISEPIKVFEPYEIVLDLPAELDPLKHAKKAATEPVTRDGAAVQLDRGTYEEIVRCFVSLVNVCREATDGRVPLAAINEQVLSRWGRLKGRLPGLGQTMNRNEKETRS